MIRTFKFAIAAMALLVAFSCGQKGDNIAYKRHKKSDYKDVKHADWVKSANIYEVNVRQYTKEGTLKAFAKELPRLRNMGVDILWFMPVYPISQKNRKGLFGSPYAVADYKAVNPDLGNMDDFKAVVSKAHDLGMKVIVDWVANHTGWDNKLITEHPDWYSKDSDGNIIVPAGTDWTDVADLNYDKEDLWGYMIGAMKFWLTEAQIDGFRCDVAGMVPTEFWADARLEFDKVKPVFMLAEASENFLCTNAFDMVYGWEGHHVMNDIAKGKKNAGAIDRYFQRMDSIYRPNDIIMNFTSNHDENAWNGSESERMGDGVKPFAVMAATVPGMPLIYSGQESAYKKRLPLFDKGEIDWGKYPLADFYKILLKLKKDNKALWNGEEGGKLVRLATGKDEAVFAFVREKDGNKVLVVLNLGKSSTEITLKGVDGKFKNAFTGKDETIKDGQKMKLAGWEYKVYSL